MAERIQINHGKAEQDATGITNAASYLQKVSFVSEDMRTTLPANANCKAAYERSQERISKLGAMLDQEAENIRGLNVAFAQFDRLLGRFEENGGRCQAITAEP
mgnify:CR=1 FL=1